MAKRRKLRLPGGGLVSRIASAIFGRKNANWVVFLAVLFVLIAGWLLS